MTPERRVKILRHIPTIKSEAEMMGFLNGDTLDGVTIGGLTDEERRDADIWHAVRLRQDEIKATDKRVGRR